MYQVKFGYEDLRIAGLANGILGQLSQDELQILYIHSYPFVEKVEETETQENETDTNTTSDIVESPKPTKAKRIKG
jgi:hypothetical protein